MQEEMEQGHGGLVADKAELAAARSRHGYGARAGWQRIPDVGRGEVAASALLASGCRECVCPQCGEKHHTRGCPVHTAKVLQMRNGNGEGIARIVA